MHFLTKIIAAILTGHVRTDYWIEGDRAHYEGCGEDANPHWPETGRHAQWVDGYYGR